MNVGNPRGGITFQFMAFSHENCEIQAHHAHAELQICIENENIKNPRKSDPSKIAYLESDFFQNTKFVFVFHICNSAHLKCFFPKFSVDTFLSCKNFKKYIKSV